ncbi:hypothetical protein ACFL0Z_02090 [Patescibacteria group bacterium]
MGKRRKPISERITFTIGGQPRRLDWTEIEDRLGIKPWVKFIDTLKIVCHDENINPEHYQEVL